MSYSNFGAVADLITNSALIVQFAWEPFEAERLRGCHRASYLLQVTPDAYDSFFNSPAGYRGQFARSVHTGEAANRALLNELGGNLLDFESNQSSPSVQLLKLSLEAADAKVWTFEPEVENHLGDDIPEILYEPWQQATSDGVGLRAPVGRYLEVKGGWLDTQGREHRDPYKASRSEDINRVGFS